MTRFLSRIWKLYQGTGDKGRGIGNEIKRALHKAIKKVTEDISELRYNTAISALMILLNEFEKDPSGVSTDDRKTFLQLLAPFAPHIAEELWAMQKGKGSIHLSAWPSYDAKVLVESTFELVVQVNGKVRGRLILPMGVTQVDAEKAIKKDPATAKYISGVPKKVVFVKNRLINFVM